jgi:hypothetical protein
VTQIPKAGHPILNYLHTSVSHGTRESISGSVRILISPVVFQIQHWLTPDTREAAGGTGFNLAIHVIDVVMSVGPSTVFHGQVAITLKSYFIKLADLLCRFPLTTISKQNKTQKNLNSKKKFKKKKNLILILIQKKFLKLFREIFLTVGPTSVLQIYFLKKFQED